MSQTAMNETLGRYPTVTVLAVMTLGRRAMAMPCCALMPLVVSGAADVCSTAQVPLNDTLRDDIASGYVSYEYGLHPGICLD